MFTLPDERGYFGKFGGAFVPEMLLPNIRELEAGYREIAADPSFGLELKTLLSEYVGRPTPLYRSRYLSATYGRSIFLKREDLAHTGAHKINNTIGQALLAKRLGKTRIIAETGAGQHGVATAAAAALFDLKCIIYMGELDTERQKLNVERMRMMGAEVRPVTSGSRTLKDATNEALRDWIAHPRDTYYLIGSVVGPHPFPEIVGHFQSVISEEISHQLTVYTGRNYPDCVIACVGGGSNALGGFYHFLDRPEVALFGVEGGGKGITSGYSAAATVLGKAGVLHGSRTLFMQDDDGQVLEAHSISAGLDYPGIGPQHAHLFATGRVTYVSATDSEAVAAAGLLARHDGIIPALESAHALAALSQLDLGAAKDVVLILSGRGDKDMEAYQKKSAHE